MAIKSASTPVAQPAQLVPLGPNRGTPTASGVSNTSGADRASLFFDRFIKAWERTQQSSEAITKSLPASVRPLIETQLIVSKLDLQAQLFTRVADVATSTVRKMQQMGGGS